MILSPPEVCAGPGKPELGLDVEGRDCLLGGTESRAWMNDNSSKEKPGLNRGIPGCLVLELSWDSS